MARTALAFLALSAITAGAGCAAAPSPSPAHAQRQSILATSSPAAGAVLHSAPDSLKLHFDPPARLDQVKVSGPQGTMPMMIESVGEVADYDLPLSGVSAGSYKVDWNATAGGKELSGSFTFTVQP